MATLVIEGIHHEIDDAFANLGNSVEESDQRLREALRGQFDIIANATMRRETKDGKLEITVVKDPGTKGSDHLLQTLLAAPDYLNPGYALDCRLRLMEAHSALDLDTLLDLQPHIQAALDAGRVEERRIAPTRRSLLHAGAVPGTSVPPGF